MGFLDNVADKAVPQGSGLKKPLVLAFISLLASGALSRKQEPAPTPSASPTSTAHAGGIVGRIRWAARKAPTEQSWRGDKIMDRERAKSTDLTRFTRFGAWSVDY